MHCTDCACELHYTTSCSEDTALNCTPQCVTHHGWATVLSEGQNRQMDLTLNCVLHAGSSHMHVAHNPGQRLKTAISSRAAAELPQLDSLGLPTTGTATTRFSSCSGKTEKTIVLSTLHQAYLINNGSSGCSPRTASTYPKKQGVCVASKIQKIFLAAAANCNMLGTGSSLARLMAKCHICLAAWPRCARPVPAPWSASGPLLCGGFPSGATGSAASPFRCLTGCGQQWLSGSHPGRSR